LTIWIEPIFCCLFRSPQHQGCPSASRKAGHSQSRSHCLSRGYFGVQDQGCSLPQDLPPSLGHLPMTTSAAGSHCLNSLPFPRAIHFRSDSSSTLRTWKLTPSFLPGRDSELHPWLGPYESPVSRFSQLVGSLLWICDSLRDAGYDTAWTNLPPAARRLRTELLFHSLNDLFTIWDDMTSPHVPSSDRFQAAACGANSTLCVMLPTFPDSQQKLHHLLETWHKNHQLVLARDTLLSEI